MEAYTHLRRLSPRLQRQTEHDGRTLCHHALVHFCYAFVVAAHAGSIHHTPPYGHYLAVAEALCSASEVHSMRT